MGNGWLAALSVGAGVLLGLGLGIRLWKGRHAEITGNGRVIRVDLEVKDMEAGEERLKVVGPAEVGELLALGDGRNGLERWETVFR